MSSLEIPQFHVATQWKAFCEARPSHLPILLFAMTETRYTSAAVRLNAIQQHLSNNTKPTSAGKADNLQPSPIEGQKYYPKPQPFDPFRPVKVGSPLLLNFNPNPLIAYRLSLLGLESVESRPQCCCQGRLKITPSRFMRRTAAWWDFPVRFNFWFILTHV